MDMMVYQVCRVLLDQRENQVIQDFSLEFQVQLVIEERKEKVVNMVFPVYLVLQDVLIPKNHRAHLVHVVT